MVIDYSRFADIGDSDEEDVKEELNQDQIRDFQRRYCKYAQAVFNRQPMSNNDAKVDHGRILKELVEAEIARGPVRNKERLISKANENWKLSLSLGDYYRYGVRGFEANESEAYRFYKKAWRSQEPEALTAMAGLAFEGFGKLNPDDKLGLTMLNVCAEKGYISPDLLFQAQRFRHLFHTIPDVDLSALKEALAQRDQKFQREEVREQSEMIDKCSNPNCSISGTAKSLLTCSGCQKVLYCSRECQKIMWKSGHKVECKLMRKATQKKKSRSKKSKRRKQKSQGKPTLQFETAAGKFRFPGYDLDGFKEIADSFDTSAMPQNPNKFRTTEFFMNEVTGFCPADTFV